MICHVKLGSRTLLERGGVAAGLDARTRLVAAATALSLLAVLVGGCGDRRRDRPPEAAGRSTDSPWFADVAPQSGLMFTHFNGMAGEFYHPEIMPPGVALFEYDNDGDLDVFIVQGQMLGSKTIDRALFPPRDRAVLRGRLFRNDLKVDADGARTLHFTDVTDASHLEAYGYGMGVATGDFNNDGTRYEHRQPSRTPWLDDEVTR